MDRRTDRQEQAVCLRQLRVAGRHAAAHQLPREPGRRNARRQHLTRERLRHGRAQRIRQAELQLRHWRLEQRGAEDAGQAVDGQRRLQPEQQEQGDVPVQPAHFEHRRQSQRFQRARDKPADGHDAVPDVRKLELRDPREPQVWRRRVELDVRHVHEQPADRLHAPGRKPRPARPDTALPAGRDRRR